MEYKILEMGDSTSNIITYFYDYDAMEDVVGPVIYYNLQNLKYVYILYS